MFDVWPQLASGRYDGVIEAAAAVGDAVTPASVAKLHALGPAPIVLGALELARARRKAIDKFDDPDTLFADAVGVEQASSSDVARHKAKRFAEAGIDRITDLCCGIGGDAMALRDVADVLAVDLQPQRAWMAGHNARCATTIADVTKLNLDGAAYHIDPDRRGGGKRRWRYEDYLPGPSFIGPLVERGGDGAIKLSPGIDFDALPSGEIEIINRRGTLVQAVLWTGRLARHERTGTRIDSDGSVHTFSGSPKELFETSEPSAYLLAVDPAIERAGLIGALMESTGAGSIHPQLGLLTSDGAVASPWLTPFELIERMPWRTRKVAEWLQSHDGGVVEVKTRGKAVDPDRAAAELRGEGATMFTVFVLRFGSKVEAWITRRK